jgi:hypothetical protein
MAQVSAINHAVRHARGWGLGWKPRRAAGRRDGGGGAAGRRSLCVWDQGNIGGKGPATLRPSARLQLRLFGIVYWHVLHSTLMHTGSHVCPTHNTHVHVNAEPKCMLCGMLWHGMHATYVGVLAPHVASAN